MNGAVQRMCRSAVLAVALWVAVSGCAPQPVVGDAAIMAPATFDAATLTAFYHSKHRVQAAGSCADVGTLAALFIEEGNREGVAGDVAFLQAMVETGWLQHSRRVPASFCNYGGLGAVDHGVTAHSFPDAVTGVRAQIQHLRAYADPSVTCSNYTTPTVLTRCSYVTKGSATTWAQMGSGRWATDPQYGAKILDLYEQLRRFAT